MIQPIEARRSTRKYKNLHVSDDLILKLLDSALLAPFRKQYTTMGLYNRQIRRKQTKDNERLSHLAPEKNLRV